MGKEEFVIKNIDKDKMNEMSLENKLALRVKLIDFGIFLKQQSALDLNFSIENLADIFLVKNEKQVTGTLDSDFCICNIPQTDEKGLFCTRCNRKV